MLGAEIIVEVLLEHDIQRIFVYPGGTIAPILDVAKQRGLDIFCSRHEQGAGYAALAAARLGQTAQVAMVTSGPGVTNIMTTIADAYYDSTPLLLFTGQVGTADLGSNLAVRQRGFQEVDAVALLSSLTKAQFQVKKIDDLAQVVCKAFHIAMSDRPGPVLVDLPMDIQRASLESSVIPEKIPLAIPSLPDVDGVQCLSQWLAAARQPLIIAGQGVLQSGAVTLLRQLVELTNIPVSHSLLGLGAIASESLHSLGFHGHTGNQYAGKAIHHADLVLVIGSRLDVCQTGNQYDDFVPNGRVVRIDIDSGEVENCRVHNDLVIYGDAKQVLEILLARLSTLEMPDLSVWWEKIRQWQKSYPLVYDSGAGLKPQAIIEQVDKLTHDKTVVCVTGVGLHQHWVARHFSFDFPHRSLLTSGGHGAMGYDLPTAIGAQLHCENCMVLCFVGDGSLQMNIQELAVVAELKLPIKIIVLDNHRLGIVSQFQKLNWQDDPTTGGKWNPDFAAISRAYGITAMTISESAASHAILQQALVEPGPVLVHCIIDSQEDIVPMLMAGQTLDKMWPYD